MHGLASRPTVGAKPNNHRRPADSPEYSSPSMRHGSPLESRTFARQAQAERPIIPQYGAFAESLPPGSPAGPRCASRPAAGALGDPVGPVGPVGPGRLGPHDRLPVAQRRRRHAESVLPAVVMPKRPLKLKVRIPPYVSPRNVWRRRLHEAVTDAQRATGVAYRETDQLEVEVRLYLEEPALFVHDVDNRLKDILDALQGRAGGPKSQQTLAPVIPNDRQVYRVVIDKSAPPKQSRGMGHLTVRRLRGSTNSGPARGQPQGRGRSGSA